MSRRRPPIQIPGDGAGLDLVPLVPSASTNHKIPKNTRETVFTRDRRTCRYCGISGVDMTLDHVKPRILGGKTNLRNLVTACEPCNKAKGARPDIRPKPLPKR